MLAAPTGSVARTTYTIVKAHGGVTGAYGSVSEDFAFLAPSLCYDARNVYLTLALGPTAFALRRLTAIRRRSAPRWTRPSACRGDLATVIGALADLTTPQGPPALDTISGQPCANFGTMNVAGNAPCS